MEMDIKSNFTVDEGLSALSRTADTYSTESVDHALGNGAAYFLSCGTWATSLVATLQHSPDDSVWTDEADATMGNTVSATLTEAGDGQINCPNPRARYTRVKLVLGGTCVAGIISILGPLRTLNS